MLEIIENVNRNGDGWIFHKANSLDININEYVSLVGGPSHTPLPNEFN